MHVRDLSMCLSVCVSVYLSVYLTICLSICLSVHWPICLSVWDRRNIDFCSTDMEVGIDVDIRIHICIYIYVYLMHIYRHRRRHGDRHVDRRRHRHIHCIDMGIQVYIFVYTYTCIQIEIWVECFLRSWSSRTHGISPFFWSFKMPYGSGARWNLKHPWLAFKKIPTNQHTSGTYQLRTQLWHLFMKKQSFHIWT